jgi:aspartate-semialdehyde dehydrogenase
MSRNLRVGIVGATGSAGQQFVVALQRHPWFTIARLAASARSAGKPFGRMSAGASAVPVAEYLVVNGYIGA